MKPNFDLLDKIVDTKGTNAKIEMLSEAINHQDTKDFIEILYNSDVYDIAEISIDKAINTPNQLFIDKKTFPEQLKFMSEVRGNNKIYILADFFSYHSMQERVWFKRALLKDFPTVGIKSYNRALKNAGLPELEIFELQVCLSVLLDVNKNVLDWNGLDPNGRNFVQHKMDGNRANIIKVGSNVSFMSRNGKEITTLGLLKEHILKKYPNDNFIIDGEIIDRNDDFQELSGKMRRLKDMSISDFKYEVFDVIKWNGEDFKNKPQYERHNFLDKTFKGDNLIEVVDTYITTCSTTIMEHFNNIVNKGGEGIIIKPENGIYEFGSRKHWWKVKPVYEGTFEIYDVVLGSGKYQGKISAIRIKDKYESIKCKVGSGLTELDVEDLTEMGENCVGKFVDIYYNGIGPRGLRFPRFKEPNKEDKIRNIRWRDDKDEADDLIPLKAKFDMIKEKQKDNKTTIDKPKEINW
jgi:DNA ligase-1